MDKGTIFLKKDHWSFLVVVTTRLPHIIQFNVQLTKRNLSTHVNMLVLRPINCKVLCLSETAGNRLADHRAIVDNFNDEHGYSFTGSYLMPDKNLTQFRTTILFVI
jgi:hypothetical protein